MIVVSDTTPLISLLKIDRLKVKETGLELRRNTLVAS